MSAVCGADAEAVTGALGFDCHDVSAWLSIRPPWTAEHWTMPLLELLVLGGAVFALVHAVRRHRQGDSANLALWCASLVYLFVIEPPLYFPEWFGLERQYGFIFAHNRFTVQFMWDRLPLYIVAFYPMISQLAYELVRSLGIFRARGALAGSVAVAFTCQVFYEVFDHLGPQLKWWAWNGNNRIVNHPALDSVPMTSMLLFASVSMGAMTYLVVRLGSGSRHGWSLVARIVAVGILTPLSMVIAGLPSSLFVGNVTAQAWILAVELALLWVAGIWIFARHRNTDEPLAPFVRFYPAVYLGVLVVFWLGAVLENGVTPGSGLYVLACFVAAGLMLTALYRARRAVPATG